MLRLLDPADCGGLALLDEGDGPLGEYGNCSGKAMIGWMGPMGMSASFSNGFSVDTGNNELGDPRRCQSFQEALMTGLTSVSPINRLSRVEPRRFSGGSGCSVCGVAIVGIDEEEMDCVLPGVATSSSLSLLRLPNSVGERTAPEPRVGEGRRCRWRGGRVLELLADGERSSARARGGVGVFFLSSDDMLYCNRSNVGDKDGLLCEKCLKPLGCVGIEAK